MFMNIHCLGWWDLCSNGMLESTVPTHGVRVWQPCFGKILCHLWGRCSNKFHGLFRQCVALARNVTGKWQIKAWPIPSNTGSAAMHGQHICKCTDNIANALAACCNALSYLRLQCSSVSWRLFPVMLFKCGNYPNLIILLVIHHSCQLLLCY